MQTFISPIDLSGSLIECHYVDGPDWVTTYGSWAARAAQAYARWLLRLAG